ncbi:ATP-binding protein [Cellulomonas chengniuliangii]|uniref:ATP-binding protein n=1 Tax=Cellulomonas chengniuliangii TaxID=2968084 RepID=UPI001D0F06A0|nr:DUF4062 domain-containing protein [Cellulomonas chengniuliangii]MCC2317367.1 DUF4062 domain-containing protein [Cellulomonas chengniuliangii]
MSDLPQIRTPDQRVRVFVSSTLEELAAERVAGRAAIERLHLAPVMFELGARPHPPRDLYRSYLAQSQIFVGVYADRYGWVAPGEPMSGLEDEYVLSAGMPRLIYVKQAATAREARLEELLDRIRNDDTTSYKSFSSAEEFASLLEDDLAHIMGERFDRTTSGSGDGSGDAPLPAALHVPLTALLGRENEVAAVGELLTSARTRLVTLVGPGGSGKTRIALELLELVPDYFVDGIWFVDLSAVREPEDVLRTIAQTLGVREQQTAPVLKGLSRVLADRKALLVLDNFEQVLAAASDIVALLQTTRALSVLVTSRSLLRVGGEHTVEVGPLGPDAAQVLFVERTRAVRPDFAVSDSDAESIAEICRRLDHLPLAIELAAARMAPLTPSALLLRIGRTLPEFARGRRDLPARQQTLRDTISWSVNLLSPPATQLFARLAVFRGVCDFEAIFAVCGAGEDEATVVALLEELVDASLVREEARDGLVFSMLMTIREFARGLLETSGEAKALRQGHGDYFVRVADDSRLPADMGTDLQAFRRLELLQEELWAAGDGFAAQGESEKLAKLSWSLLFFAWVGNQIPHILGWADICLRDADALSRQALARITVMVDSMMMEHSDRHDPTRLASHADLLHNLGDVQGESFARAMLGWFHLHKPIPDVNVAERELLKAFDLGTLARDILSTSMSQLTLGKVALAAGDVDNASTRFQSLHSGLETAGYEPALIMTLNTLAWAELAKGKAAEAEDMARRAFDLAVRLGHQEGIAYGLERLGSFAALHEDWVRSARLLGAGRRRREVSDSFTFSVLEDYLPLVTFALGEANTLAEMESGMAMAPDEAIAYAHAFRMTGQV